MPPFQFTHLGPRWFSGSELEALVTGLVGREVRHRKIHLITGASLLPCRRGEKELKIWVQFDHKFYFVENYVGVYGHRLQINTDPRQFIVECIFYKSAALGLFMLAQQESAVGRFRNHQLCDLNLVRTIFQFL